MPLAGGLGGVFFSPSSFLSMVYRTPNRQERKTQPGNQLNDTRIKKIRDNGTEIKFSSTWNNTQQRIRHDSPWKTLTSHKVQQSVTADPKERHSSSIDSTHSTRQNPSLRPGDPKRQGTTSILFARHHCPHHSQNKTDQD